MLSHQNIIVRLLGFKAPVIIAGAFLIYSNMRKYFILFLSAWVITGCDIQKESAKRKTDTSITEGWEQSEKRPSETVFYRPPVNYFPRDTTIVVVNSEGSKIRLQYDKDGKMKEAECLPALIDLVTKMSLKFDHTEKEKTKEKQEKFNSDWILYIMIGFVLVACFGFYLMYLTINKNSKAIEVILAKIGNK